MGYARHVSLKGQAMPTVNWVSRVWLKLFGWLLLFDQNGGNMKGKFFYICF